jgi:hypothetical protein
MCEVDEKGGTKFMDAETLIGHALPNFLETGSVAGLVVMADRIELDVESDSKVCLVQDGLRSMLGLDSMRISACTTIVDHTHVARSKAYTFYWKRGRDYDQFTADLVSGIVKVAQDSRKKKRMPRLIAKKKNGR